MKGKKYMAGTQYLKNIVRKPLVIGGLAALVFLNPLIEGCKTIEYTEVEDVGPGGAGGAGGAGGTAGGAGAGGAAGAAAGAAAGR